MSHTVPMQLHELLHASDAIQRDTAWEQLIGSHTRLLLAVARAFGGGHDATMDRYAYVLEKLRESDFRRLRSYERGRGATFSTWLTVTARRLCLDHQRVLYGRGGRAAAGTEGTSRELRRTLANHVLAGPDVDLLSDADAVSEDVLAMHRERDALLRAALATLEPRDRLLLALRFDDGLPASRIAGLLELASPFHVYRRVGTLLGRLRVLLESSGVSDADG